MKLARRGRNNSMGTIITIIGLAITVYVVVSGLWILVAGIVAVALTIIFVKRCNKNKKSERLIKKTYINSNTQNIEPSIEDGFIQLKSVDSYDQSNDTIQSLKSQLDQSNDTIQSLKSQLDQSNDTIQSLKSQLESKNEDIESYKRRNERILKMRGALKEGIEDKLRQQLLQAQQERDDKAKLLDELNTAFELQTLGTSENSYLGICESIYNEIRSSEEWGEALDKQIEESKKIVKEHRACICKTSWTVNGSVSQGKKMTNDTIKIALLVFNTVVERACNYVRGYNFDTWQNKVVAAYRKINTLNKVNDVEITDEYLQSRLKELAIVQKYKEAKQLERERSREIRRKANEEKRERERLERAEKDAQEKLEKQRQMAEQTHAAMQQQIEENIRLLKIADEKGLEISELKSKIKELEDQIKAFSAESENTEQELIADIVHIQDRKETMQSGFVYIISNVGAFGDGVFKIGVTRRDDPLERVNELGNASVPFKFCVHSIIPSEQAFKLENTIHKRLREYRVNLVNGRKEFFRLDVNKLREVINEIVPGAEFTMDVSDEQYSETMMIRNNPDRFSEWLKKYNEKSYDDEEETEYKKLGLVDSSLLDSNKQYEQIEEYTSRFEQICDKLNSFSSTPVLRVTKYYIAIYMQLENSMKKIMTFYKSGDGKPILSFSIQGYTGEETKGVRKSIPISEFDLDKYIDIINDAALQADNQLIELCSINI